MKTKQPTDVYDVEAWNLYYAQHPGMKRSVGAEAVEDASEDTATEDVKAEDVKAEDTKAEDTPDAKPDDKPEETNWRDSITDPDARKIAEDSTDLNHLAKRMLDMRKRLSNAIVKPGKDATPEDLAAYRKAMDIPEDKDGYGLSLPDDAEEDRKASLDRWKGIFHEKGVPKGLAAELVAEVQKEHEEGQKAIAAADKKFADEQDSLLKKEWGADYEPNKTFGDRALSTLADWAGVSVEELRNIETKEGRFLLDDARIARVIAAVGREMGEGDLGPVSGSEVERIQDQIEEVRTKISEAQDKGDSKKANQLFQKEQDLLRRLGNKAA